MPLTDAEFARKKPPWNELAARRDLGRRRVSEEFRASAGRLPRATGRSPATPAGPSGGLDAEPPLRHYWLQPCPGMPHKPRNTTAFLHSDPQPCPRMTGDNQLTCVGW